MSFRVAVATIWALVALLIARSLRGGFGIRIPHAYQSWLPANAGPWLLWVWAAVLIVGGGFLVAYLLAEGIHIAAPRLVR